MKDAGKSRDAPGWARNGGHLVVRDAHSGDPSSRMQRASQ